MKHYFAGNPKGFYSDEVHEDNIPDDKIEITESEYFTLINTPGAKGIGPSGRPEIKPSKFHTLNSAGDAWEVTAENQAIKEPIEAEALRVEGITQGRENSGLKKITIEQAYDFIDNKFDAAANAAETKEAIRLVLKKMIPHLLK